MSRGIDKFVLLIVNRKSLECTKQVAGFGSAMIRMYAFRNPPKKSEDGYLINLRTGEVEYKFTGKGKDEFPDFEEHVGNIDDMFYGLLDQLRSDNEDYLSMCGSLTTNS